MDQNIIITEGKGITIDANCKLEDLAKSPYIFEYRILEQALNDILSESKMIYTIKDELYRELECKFYKDIDIAMPCFRRGGTICHGPTDDDQNYSLFGTIKGVKTACEKACPNETEISLLFELLRKNKKEVAADLLFHKNPFSAITGRICTHNCKNQCVRANYDEAVEIQNVERFLGDYILSNYFNFLGEPPEMSGRRVAIVGSGLAGLSAAFFLKEYGHAVTIFEKENKIGGNLNNINESKLPKNIIDKVINMLKDIGVEFKIGSSVKANATYKDYIENFHGVFIDDKSETITTKEGVYETDIGGIFTPGDVRGKPAIFSIHGGRKAAEAMNNYLGRGKVSEPEDNLSDTDDFAENKYGSFDISCSRRLESVKMIAVPKEQVESGAEEFLGYDEMDCLKEVKRCFNCGCAAILPSILATVFTALDAKFITTERTIDAENFYTGIGNSTNVLEEGEELLKVYIQKPFDLSKVAYRRKGDILLVMNSYIKEGVIYRTRIALGGVSPTPYRPKKSEFMLFKKPLGEKTVEAVNEVLLQEIIPFLRDEYKKEIVTELLKTAILN